MATITKSAFSIGAVSKMLYRRVDLAQHAYACEKVHNAIVLPSGAVARRPGTQHVAAAAAAGVPSNLRLFRFALNDIYVLEFSDLTIRVYKGGVLQVEIVSPYTAAEAFELKTDQLNDVIYMTHPSHPIKTLIRASDAVWAIADLFSGSTTGRGPTNTDPTQVEVDNGIYPPGYFVNVTGGTLDLPIGSEAVLWIYDTGIADWRRMVMIWNGTYGLVSDATMVPPLSGGSIAYTTQWAYEVTTGESQPTKGNPANVFFYQDRLCFSTTASEPKTIYMSTTGIYKDFEIPEPLTDDSPLVLQITEGTDGTPIYWVESLKYLISNAGASVIWLSSASGSGAVTPTSKQASVGSYVSLAPVPPAKIKNELVAAGDDLKSLFAVGVNTSTDEFPIADLTALYPDLFSDESIKQVVYQSKPWSIVWVVTEEGNLYGFSYDRELQLTAWHTHELGADTGSASVNSILIVPTTSGDQLWMTVSRPGDESQSIEYIEFVRDTTDTGQVLVDSYGSGNYAYEHDITPLMPAYPDNSGLTDGDEIRIGRVSLSLTAASDFTVTSGAGTINIAEADVPPSGNTRLRSLPTFIDDDTSISIKSSEASPFTLTAVRYEVEVQ